MLTWFDISFSLPVPAILVRIAAWITLLYRRMRYGYAFRRIKLTQGYFAIVEPADYPRLSRYNWRLCRTKGKNTLYAERSIRMANGKYSRILMHREIMSHACPEQGRGEPQNRVTSDEPRLPRAESRGVTVIDHINRNGLDNRLANLRLATVTQNAWNSKNRNSRSDYKGVWFAAEKGLWRAAIVHEGRKIHLGYFKDKTDAARKYDEAAKKYRGQFALLNFPD